MGLARTVSEIYGDFSRKSQNFPTPCIFCILHPAEGVLLEFGIGTGDQITRMMWLRADKKLMISSAIWIECTNVTDRRADGRTPDHSKDCVYA